MPSHLAQDHDNLDQVIERTVAEASEYLSDLTTRPVGALLPASFAQLSIPEGGVGAQGALGLFKDRYARWLSGSAGPRYFGFVTGGVTPAALAGDWLAAVYDQNALGSDESVAAQIELDTLALLRQLFGLSDAHTGSFVTGATMANFVGLALARQWAGHQVGQDIAQQGLAQSAPTTVYSGTPHASIYKALAMLGMGRGSLTTVRRLPEREAVDVAALEAALKGQGSRPSIMVANAGTVNTVDFDDLTAIASLKNQYNFWLHVDAAFGGFAACAPTSHHLVQGMDLADSITIDAHKWLNVPYDAAMQFSRHHTLQAEVFQNAAVYLGQEVGPGNFVHLTPENSRRLRALPSWFTLMAYGSEGYRHIVEECCRLAGWLGAQIEVSAHYTLLAPVRLNGICFTLANQAELSLPAIHDYLNRVTATGAAFLTPTVYDGTPALRISITNWRTTQADVALAWQALQQAAEIF